MADFLVWLAQSPVGIIGGIILTVVIGMIILRKITDNNWILLGLILIIILVAKNRFQFGDILSPIPDIGTVANIASGYAAGEGRYQDCLAAYIEKEIENPANNARLKTAYDNCKRNFSGQYQACLQSVQSDHLIINKPSYCDDKVRDDFLEGCLQTIIADYSNNGSSPVENCKRGLTSDTVKWTAGVFSGQGGEERQDSSLWKRTRVFFTNLWNRFAE